MNKNKKAETFVSIMVGLLIFSIIAIAIIDVTYFNKELTDNYEILTIENILKNNSDAILKKISLNSLNQDEKFYIYKNKTTKNFEILTGATNSGYIYIDMNGDKVINPNNSNSLVYKREMTLKNDFIKYIKTPNSINNLVLHLDGQDPDGNGTQPGDNTVVNSWIDKSGKGNNGAGAGAPRFKLNSINGFSSVNFDGLSDRFNINNNTELNTSGTGYTEKSFALVFKTGTSTFGATQIVYEQGDNTSGYAIGIDSGNLVANIWGGVGGAFSRTIGKIYQNTVYSIIVVQDTRYSPAYNNFSIYLNGKIISSVAGLNSQNSSTGSISIGRVDTSSYSPLLSTGNYFLGNIGEIIIWNKALTKNEIIGINNYLDSRRKTNFITNNESKVNSLIKNIKVYIPK